MAIPKMEDDVEIITKLGDVPGSDDGLSTLELKKRFDLASIRIKEFINKILIPSIENSVDEESLLSQIGKALGQKLSLSGGTMTGVINMNGKGIYNLKTPTQDSDAASKKYVDDAKKAAETYTDNKHLPLTASISPDGWTGDAPPYTQAVAVEGIKKEDHPHLMPVYSDVLETALLEKDAWTMVSDANATDGAITFICFEEKPSVTINIQIEVNR